MGLFNKKSFFMKIPAQLPQFVDENTLFVVSGIQAADFYLAFKGELESVGNIALEKVHYSDRENFGRRGSLVFGSGDRVGQLKKDKRKDFLNLIEDFTKKLAVEHKIDSIYLFAPAGIIKDIQKSLPAGWVKKIKEIFEGNFHKEKPLVILKKL